MGGGGGKRIARFKMLFSRNFFQEVSVRNCILRLSLTVDFVRVKGFRFRPQSKKFVRFRYVCSGSGHEKHRRRRIHNHLGPLENHKNNCMKIFE